MKKKWVCPQISELQARHTEQYNNSSGFDWYGADNQQAGFLLSLGSSRTDKSTIVIKRS